MTENRPHSAAPLRVLGVNGSMHEKGVNIAVLSRFLRMVGEHGAETRLLDLRVAELPVYSPDRQMHTAARERVAADMNWAQALVLASPDYHGSMSGAMKNFLDYSWSECAGKLFAYIVASHEKGLTVMDHMRTVVRQCYGWSLPYGASFDPKIGEAAARLAKDPESEVFTPQFENRLKMMARDLAVFGTLLHRQFAADLAGDEEETFAAAYRKFAAS